jgi:hypothetical protein
VRVYNPIKKFIRKETSQGKTQQTSISFEEKMKNKTQFNLISISNNL